MTVHHSQKDINKKTSTFLRLYDAKLAEISCDCYGYCNLYIITSTYIKKTIDLTSEQFQTHISERSKYTKM